MHTTDLGMDVRRGTWLCGKTNVLKLVIRSSATMSFLSRYKMQKLSCHELLEQSFAITTDPLDYN